MPESLHCLDTQCDHSHHSAERDSMVLDLLVSIIEVSHSKIPKVGGRVVKAGCKDKSGNIPG